MDNQNTGLLVNPGESFAETKGTLIAGGKSGFHATRAQVEEVPTPKGDRFYTPVPFGSYLQIMEKILQDQAVKIVAQAYALNHARTAMFGMWDIQNGSGADDWRSVIGFRTAHTRRMSLGLVAGSNVLNCTNICFWGEVKVLVPHRGYNLESRLTSSMTRGVLQTKDFTGRLNARIDRWKDTWIHDDEARATVLLAAEAGAIPTSKILPVFKEYQQPRHESYDPRTVWSLHNAFTEIQKTRTAATTFEDTLKLTKVFEERFPSLN